MTQVPAEILLSGATSRVVVRYPRNPAVQFLLLRACALTPWQLSVEIQVGFSSSQGLHPQSMSGVAEILFWAHLLLSIALTEHQDDMYLLDTCAGFLS